MTPFEAYETFLALRQHFRVDSYDYIKYHGKTNVSSSGFNRRRDKFRFEKLARQKDPFLFLLANFADGDSTWVGDITSPEAEETFTNWKKRTEAMTYHVTAEIKYLHEKYGDFDSFIFVAPNEYPKLLSEYLRKKVSIETLIIINDLTDCFKYWSSKVEDRFTWQSIELKCKKYRRFIDIDAEKYRQIIIDTFSEV